MAVKIRLKRMGKIRAPFYRIVVMDSRSKRDGRAIEEIGKYHPTEEPSFIEIKSERALYWLGVGAQPTEQVEVLLKITGDWQKFKGLPGQEGTLRVKGEKAPAAEAIKKAEDEAELKKAKAAEAKEAKAKEAEKAPAEEAPAAEVADEAVVADDAAASEDVAVSEDAAPAVEDAAEAAPVAEAAAEEAAEAPAAEAAAESADSPESADSADSAESADSADEAKES